MNKTNIKLKFKITGNSFSPEQITNELGIQPTKTWRKGDEIQERKKDIKRTFDCWQLSTDYEESLDINEELSKIVPMLKAKEEILVDLHTRLNLQYEFAFVIRIENNETPAIYLEKDIIEFANSIKAEFDFDMYIF